MRCKMSCRALAVVRHKLFWRSLFGLLLIGILAASQGVAKRQGDSENRPLCPMRLESCVV